MAENKSRKYKDIMTQDILVIYKIPLTDKSDNTTSVSLLTET